MADTEDQVRRQNVETCRQFIDSMDRPHEMVEFVTDDVVTEFPFALGGMPPRLEGKQALLEFYVGAQKFFATIKVVDPEIHAGHDPDDVVSESRGTGRLLTGEEYDNTYLQFFRFRDGKIARFREYFNQLQVQKVLEAARSSS